MSVAVYTSMAVNTYAYGFSSLRVTKRSLQFSINRQFAFGFHGLEEMEENCGQRAAANCSPNPSRTEVSPLCQNVGPYLPTSVHL